MADWAEIDEEDVDETEMEKLGEDGEDDDGSDICGRRQCSVDGFVCVNLMWKKKSDTFALWN